MDLLLIFAALVLAGAVVFARKRNLGKSGSSSDSIPGVTALKERSFYSDYLDRHEGSSLDHGSYHGRGHDCESHDEDCHDISGSYEVGNCSDGDGGGG